MKLKDEFIKLPKEMVYDMYHSLVYKTKDYDSITRGKMLEEIIEEYQQDRYLYSICTERELLFLKYSKEKKMTKKDLEKYEWEIKELNKKGIFSLVTLEVFEEQQENVLEALDYLNIGNKKDMDELVIFMISTIKIHGSMLVKAFISMINSFFGVKEEDINRILGNPLFHFYCEFHFEWFEPFHSEEEIVSYRAYWDILEDLDEARKMYGMGGGREYNPQDVYDTFYYGFPIGKEKVKKMVDAIKKHPLKEFLFRAIDEARVLNDRHGLQFLVGKDLMKIINEALDEIPCAAMNGFTPKEYAQGKIEEFDLNKKFIAIPQNNAHLCKSAADLYYKLYLALLDYTNKKQGICKKLKKIYKQEGLDAKELKPINDYLWEHKEIIDEFVKKNDCNFNEEELEIIKGFKSAITSENFVVVGFEKEYTQILSVDEGKLYMVKGIRTDLDKIINPKNLPKVISTTLLMFKGNIIFNSFLSSMDVELGNDFNKQIVEEMESAIKYYHL